MEWMDAQSTAIHKGCMDKRPRALSYSHTLPEQGQLATYKRVISSEKIDSGLPLSASCVCMCMCVLHMLYNHSLREAGRMNAVLSLLYFQYLAFPQIFKVGLQSTTVGFWSSESFLFSIAHTSFNINVLSSEFVKWWYMPLWKPEIIFMQWIYGQLLHIIMKRDPPIMKLLLP